MDNHPIPQDVTGFQFRLIGDMTIKQFAYLTAGVVLAWICLSLPVLFFLKLPLVVFFGGTGVIFAFIPIAGRPADTMIFYFLKAVFSPTQYIYKQASPQQPTTTAGQQPDEQEKPKEEKKDVTVKLDNQVNAKAFDELFGEKKQKVTEPQQPLPNQPELEQKPQTFQSQPDVDSASLNEQKLSKEASAVAQKIVEAQKEETSAHDQQEALEAHAKVSDLESQLEAIRTQKDELEAKLLELQKQLSQKPQQVFTPSTEPAPKITENVRKVPANLAKTVGAPFVSDTPNLISGIVKDPRGNVLPNILIEVKDKDSNPVRAFKTNPLGQFASATPVINGTYTLTFEDPNNKQRFDAVEMTASGTVLQPLEVISIDAREDLRKELFGS